jgi:hypothetical protein
VDRRQRKTMSMIPTGKTYQANKNSLFQLEPKKKARAEHESNYRDRAKERREGKNIRVDYQGQASLLE